MVIFWLSHGYVHLKIFTIFKLPLEIYLWLCLTQMKMKAKHKDQSEDRIQLS